MKNYFFVCVLLKISRRRNVSCAPKKQSKLRAKGPTKNIAPTKTAITKPRFFFVRIHFNPISNITGVNIATMLFAAIPKTPILEANDVKI